MNSFSNLPHFWLSADILLSESCESSWTSEIPERFSWKRIALEPDCPDVLLLSSFLCCSLPFCWISPLSTSERCKLWLKGCSLMLLRFKPRYPWDVVGRLFSKKSSGSSSFVVVFLAQCFSSTVFDFAASTDFLKGSAK